MTTIACRNGVLAGDTRVTEGDMILPERHRKIHRLPDGTLFAYAGCIENAAIMKNALARQMPIPKLEQRGKEDAYLHIKRDGSIFYSTGVAWVRTEGTRMAAIGSGAAYALAAMRAGNSPKKAVKIASDLDPYTGGGIHVLRLKQPSVKKKVARSRRR